MGKAANRLKPYVICYLLFHCTLTLGYASENLTASKDSLIHLLDSASVSSRRLELLTHLSDIGLIQDDYTYTEKLWEQAVASNNQDAMFTSVRSLALRHLNLCQLDSADLWIEKARIHLRGKPKEVVLQYLGMMHDIRSFTQRKELAQRLVADSQVVFQASNPYPYMRRLYALGVISLMLEGSNDQLRPWDSYLQEGLKIARTIPLEEDYLFRTQFLLGLGSSDLKYTQELMELYKEYRQLPKVKNAYSSHTR